MSVRQGYRFRRWSLAGCNRPRRRQELQSGGAPYFAQKFSCDLLSISAQIMVVHLTGLDYLEYLLVPRMLSEWIKIRVVFDPSVLQLVAGVGKQTVQQIERLLDIAQERINTGDIVLRQD